MRLMLSMSFKTQLLLISKYNQYIAICIIYFPLMNLKNNIKSKQMQTVRHNPDKDSCSSVKVRLHWAKVNAKAMLLPDGLLGNRIYCSQEKFHTERTLARKKNFLLIFVAARCEQHVGFHKNPSPMWINHQMHWRNWKLRISNDRYMISNGKGREC